MKCPNCGYFNMPGATTCGQCRRELASKPASGPVPLDEYYPPRASNRSVRENIEANSPQVRLARRFVEKDWDTTRADLKRVREVRVTVRAWMLSLLSLVPGLGQCLQHRYGVAAVLVSLEILTIGLAWSRVRHWSFDLLVVGALAVAAISMWDTANKNFPPSLSGLPQILRWVRLGLMSVLTVSVLVVGAFYMASFRYGFWTLAGDVAAPALLRGDSLLVRRLNVERPLRYLSRGDIVVCADPNEYNGQLTERVLGLPGDIVEFANGAIMVNGRKLRRSELPLSFEAVTSQANIARLTLPPFKVQAGPHEIVVWSARIIAYGGAGNNRVYIKVLDDTIQGRAIAIYQPPDRRRWLR